MRSRSIPTRSSAQELLVISSCDEIAAWRFSRSKDLLLRLCDNRQYHANRRAFADLTLGFDAAAVQLRDVFDNRQAKTGSPNASGTAGFIDAIEALENARQIFFADADAVIAHAQFDFIIAPPSHQPNLAVLTRIFHGVIKQIVECFLEPRPVSANRGQVGRKIDNYV